jgi:hypothetical protein
MNEKKYGDMVNGIGRAGFVKSIEVDDDGVKFAFVETELINRFARVYLVPPVWEEYRFPEIGDRILMRGLGGSKKRDVNSNYYDIAGKAIFCENWSLCLVLEIRTVESDVPFAIVECSNHGDKIKLPLSSSVWFENEFPREGSKIFVCAITLVDGEYIAGGGCSIRY